MTMTMKMEKEGASQSECRSLSPSVRPADAEEVDLTGVCLLFVNELGQNLQITMITR